MAMLEQVQSYIKTLNVFGEVLIPHEEWTPEFEHSFRTQLKSYGIDEIRIYQATQPVNYKLICKMSHSPKVQVQQAYAERSSWIRLLPVLGVVLVYFLLVSLWAMQQEKMLSAAFLLLLPFSFGAIIEYTLTLRQPQSLGRSLLQQFWVVVGLLLVGGVILREGVICLIMTAPIYWLCATLGAISMRVLCRWLWKPYKKVYSIALLPLFGLWMPDFSQYHNGYTHTETLINAPAQVVFASLNHVQQIQPQEIKYSPIFSMGFPRPIAGMTEKTEDGLIRQIYWQRNIHFQEKVIQLKPAQTLAWTYIFTSQSFPKGSFDDHLKIGGAYFNLLSTVYELQPINPEQTKLTLRIDYRLSTEVNWYANLWTRYVLSEFSEVVMHIHKQRAERLSKQVHLNNKQNRRSGAV